MNLKRPTRSGRQPLPGLSAEQQKQIERAIVTVIETVYSDLHEAWGRDFDNEALMETVADHMHDYPGLYDRRGRVLSREAHAAWLAIPRETRWPWMLANFHYV